MAKIITISTRPTSNVEFYTYEDDPEYKIMMLNRHKYNLTITYENNDLTRIVELDFATIAEREAWLNDPDRKNKNDINVTNYNIENGIRSTSTLVD
jgi:hypothetical protein